MNGYGVIVKRDDFIYNVFLVDEEDNVPPIRSIQQHCEQSFPTMYGSCWDEYKDLIEWFTVKDVERLKAIDWPEQRSDADRDIQQLAKIQIYRAFKIKPVTLIQALDSLGNEVITKATGLGWSPLGIGPVLHLLAWSMNEADQAEAYREDIMDMADDIELAVSSAESIYENDAYQFLEKENEARSGSREPKDMADDELINEATQSYCSIYASDVTGRVREFFTDTVMANRWGSGEVIRHAALETELFNRGYEVRTVLTPSSYSVQKREEE